MQQSQQIIPFIVGPTAVGKTATAIELAKRLNGEIISIDSRQVYKGLDVGTAKPTLRQQKEIPHHLIDILEPSEQISAGTYRELALVAVADILSRDKLPIFVGGSGMYVKALVQGIFQESLTDKSVRDKIKAELDKKGIAELYNRLVDIDPELAVKIHLNDTKRITRALEIYEITGKPPSAHYRNQETESPFPNRIFVLTMERENLYQRINERVDQMIQDGLVDEVQALLNSGLRKNLDSLLTLGYQEVVTYLDGECSYAEMVENIKRNTRRYAKRQLTWFRNQLEATWITITPETTISDVTRQIFQNILTNDNQ
ncbi:tRNA (adenosine(37)-N6)-dimethylallyltransferase MiaA [bacterium]|nr:tRNA (adenosine(37)-N6)-dimethylallyltransferase MiaA [bacterium]MBU1064737.1 tRNA (adenosine(37)-N6)-dimethylallyltransferase MiaA [bacterium]MBU1874667.1 tRNA (adenosine(37)-N6)-dimethylallyltransferase MiaA [bacterium]